ncbi:hypothetical protein QR680_014651 [Steinernema hermaphroditum]|uniref:3-hydroxy-3-methylglutaryl-coenzyme A reductase n=1 Tax=Steinernema hermaphroditum TaxID=289476 RepID=A0AA39I9N2_9BILA|nr:hypothetical protein QR680_014651 [Steinernema hermaphroditum]
MKMDDFMNSEPLRNLRVDFSKFLLDLSIYSDGNLDKLIELAVECFRKLSPDTLVVEKRQTVPNSQTIKKFYLLDTSEVVDSPDPTMSFQLDIFNSDASKLSDDAILQLLEADVVKHPYLEEEIGDLERSVAIRRRYIENRTGTSLKDILFKGYNYDLVYKACCENVIGFTSVPIGVVGPLRWNGESSYIPMATTEGALLASTNRGCKVIRESGGAMVRVFQDEMTRAPMVRFEDGDQALQFYNFIKDETNFDIMKERFESTTRYGKLLRIKPVVCADNIIILRFSAFTGDAMGMNMVTKGAEEVMKFLKTLFPTMDLLTVSSNYCSDKKAAQINWDEGRGKSVEASCIIPAKVVENVLRTTVDRMVDVGHSKCQIGASMAGTIGGWNCHAANPVAAIFIATGQDAAQVVSSSMCLTSWKKTETGDLKVSCLMKCLEVGTMGGGTILPSQNAALEMLKCAGGRKDEPGSNPKRLAKIVAATILAGEISLLAAQCTHTLVSSHMTLNRSKVKLNSGETGDVYPSNDKTEKLPEDCDHIL